MFVVIQFLKMNPPDFHSRLIHACMNMIWKFHHPHKEKRSSWSSNYKFSTLLSAGSLVQEHLKISPFVHLQPKKLLPTKDVYFEQRNEEDWEPDGQQMCITFFLWHRTVAFIKKLEIHPWKKYEMQVKIKISKFCIKFLNFGSWFHMDFSNFYWEI